MRYFVASVHTKTVSYFCIVCLFVSYPESNVSYSPVPGSLQLRLLATNEKSTSRDIEK